jgi:hypothetical protein
MLHMISTDQHCPVDSLTDNYYIFRIEGIAQGGIGLIGIIGNIIAITVYIAGKNELF